MATTVQSVSSTTGNQPNGTLLSTVAMATRSLLSSKFSEQIRKADILWEQLTECTEKWPSAVDPATDAGCAELNELVAEALQKFEDVGGSAAPSTS